MATWAAIGIVSYMRLLDGHVGRNRYSYLHELILSSSKTIYIYTHIVFIEVKTDLYMV